MRFTSKLDGGIVANPPLINTFLKMYLKRENVVNNVFVIVQSGVVSLSNVFEIMASGPITSWQIDGGNNGNSDRLYFFGLQNHCRW